jgi:hypothetical protein
MLFEQKYLKYKKKYLELKKQVGGFINLHEYKKFVPEFSDKMTKQDFFSNNERLLNVITIKGDDDYEETRHNILNNIRKIENPHDTEVKEFLELLRANSKEIIELAGYYNKQFDFFTNKEQGTYVEHKNFNIFKDEQIRNIDKKLISKDGKFDSSKGSGKKHLNTVLNCYKTKGAKYLFFDVAGIFESSLVTLYKNMGFKILIKNYDFYIGSDRNPTTNQIMFGKIDDVISMTNT